MLTAFTAVRLLIVLAVYVYCVVRGKQVIEDANGEPYLVRYFLYKPGPWVKYIGLDDKKLGRIYLHHILRSDYDRALHDHPWSFTSLMLKGRYVEIADRRQIKSTQAPKWTPLPGGTGESWRMFQAPCVLRRGAGWRHRLVLPHGVTTWTLVFIGAKVRSWGFWTDLANNKWCPWRKYDTRRGICNEPDDMRWNGEQTS